MTGATPGVTSVRLVQSGGIAGLEMSASVLLADLPSEAADRTRGLAEQVLAERATDAPAPAGRDMVEYELLISRTGLSAGRIVAHDGALTPAQQELIGILRPHLAPG